MKKPVFYTLSTVLAFAAFSVMACGGDTGSKSTPPPTAEAAAESTPEATPEATPEVTTEPTPEVTTEPTPEPTPEATEAPAVELTDEELAAKVKEYCDAARPAIEAQKELYDSLGMSVELKAEGFDSVTEYYYKEQMEVDTEALTSQLDIQWSTFKAMYDELSAYTGSDKVRVVLRYINADGSKILDYIVDKTYHAE